MERKQTIKHYANFDVFVAGLGSGRYAVRTEFEGIDTGTREEVAMPFAVDPREPPLRDYDAALQASSARKASLAHEPAEKAGDSFSADAFGGSLFTTLFQGTTLAHYRKCHTLTEERRQGLRIRLIFRDSASELAALPWEFLYDEERVGSDGFLALYKSSPIVRYLAIDKEVRAPKVDGSLRVLGIMANPRGDLSLKQEMSDIKESLGPLLDQEKAEITWIENATYPEIQTYLRKAALGQENWHIIHFVGHSEYDEATQEGVLLLCNEEGEEHRLPVSLLAQQLDACQATNLVVLNSCEGAQAGVDNVLSSAAAALVCDGVPAVVAMQQRISDKAAVRFAAGLYASLAAGSTIDHAVTDARARLRSEWPTSIEWATPVLFLRADQGQLFDMSAGGAPQLGPNTARKCDRQAQETAFEFQLWEQEEIRGRTPQLFVIPGPEGQGHDSLVERLTDEYVGPLAEKLGGVERGTYVGPVEVPWADDAVAKDRMLDDLKRQLAVGLQKAARDNSLRASQLTAERLLKSPKFKDHQVVVLEHAIGIERWTERSAALIRWLLDDFWGSLEAGPDTPLVLIFLRVVYPEAAPAPRRGLLSFLGGKTSVESPAVSIRRELAGIFGPDQPRACPALLFDDLEPIDRGHVEFWLSTKVMMTEQVDRTPKVEEIFGTETELSYSVVEPYLKKIVEELQPKILDQS